MTEKKTQKNHAAHPHKKGRGEAPAQKKAIVKRMIELMEEYPIVSVVNMENLPAKQLTNIRAQLRGKVELIMTKKTFMKMALEQSKKPNVRELEKYLGGMPALLFTKDNPFALFKLLKKNRSKAPIKGGQTAPNDIVVHAGPTNFNPGPIIGELGGFRIKSGIEGGKVAIKEDAVVAKEGTVVPEKLASLLARLGIEPMEIGLNLKVSYENGNFLGKDVLDIDEEAFKIQIATAASNAFNVAVYVAYMTADTLSAILGKAHNDAKALAKQQNILTSETVGDVLALADAQMHSLKHKMGM